ncbi:hypothetical protein L1987_38508 [Smallanthus sonchifolius]|uniref:Uncharacterized protein n=1 Tax=Smallanthus sonchifolius TaxID=185202 RepID=A0ACB9HIU7_9ASTR|nr:hypothetical protein L1987_38508 [Smallanthus sonchifolius]
MQHVPAIDRKIGRVDCWETNPKSSYYVQGQGSIFCSVQHMKRVRNLYRTWGTDSVSLGAIRLSNERVFHRHCQDDDEKIRSKIEEKRFKKEQRFTPPNHEMSERSYEASLCLFLANFWGLKDGCVLGENSNT